MSQHVVITGGASGLGLGAARRFLALGHSVTILDVNETAGQALVEALRPLLQADAQLAFERVDLADAASIQAVAERMNATDRAIDVLVNNAGIYPPSRLTRNSEGRELTFAIAHLGHFRLTHALWPLLTAAPSARVISVSSLVQRRTALDITDLDFAKGYEPIKAYGQAKLSCLLFALALHEHLQGAHSRVQSYAVHPGVVRTPLGSNRKRSPDDSPWQRFSSWALSKGLGNVGQSPEKGAECIVVAAITTEFPAGSFIGPTLWMESVGCPKLVTLGAAARTPGLAQALWQKTEALTGLRWTF